MSVVQLSSKTVKKLPITLGEPDVIRSLQLLPESQVLMMLQLI